MADFGKGPFQDGEHYPLKPCQKDSGTLPLLKPVDEVAGRKAPLMGAYYLAKGNGDYSKS